MDINGTIISIEIVQKYRYRNINIGIEKIILLFYLFITVKYTSRTKILAIHSFHVLKACRRITGISTLLTV